MHLHSSIPVVFEPFLFFGGRIILGLLVGAVPCDISASSWHGWALSIGIMARLLVRESLLKLFFIVVMV